MSSARSVHLTTFPVTALAASFPYYNPSTGAAATPDTIYKPSGRYFDLGAGNLTVSVPAPYGFAYRNNMNLVFNESKTLAR